MAFDEQYSWFMPHSFVVKAMKWKRRPGQNYDIEAGSWSSRHTNLLKLWDEERFRRITQKWDHRKEDNSVCKRPNYDVLPRLRK